MKKTLLTFAFLLSMVSNLWAQDTILMLGPKENYFDNYWFFNAGDTCKFIYLEGNGAWRYITPDTLTIYGIVTSLNLKIRDTSQTDFTELLRIYKHLDSNVYQLGELSVSMDDPPTYYMRQNLIDPSYPDPVLPVYERYFQEPIVVTDSFYVGTFPIKGFRDKNIRFLFIKDSYDNYWCPMLAHLAYYPQSPTYPETWQYYETDQLGLPYLYAILMPPDTTGAGIGEQGVLGRFTGVSPNPAAETAKVVSSFGLSRVEAYNLAGEKVGELQLPTPSVSTTLDVRSWPVGAYILCIHTPQGVATKKLTVTR